MLPSRKVSIELKKQEKRQRRINKTKSISKKIVVPIVIICFLLLVTQIVSQLINDDSVYVDYEASESLDRELGGQVIYNWDEKRFAEVLHKMTHQKVRAAKKIGAIQITEKRIKTLQKALQQNKKKYKHTKLYEEILNEWSNGDFSHVVKQHNELLHIIDKDNHDSIAISKMSKAEENQFIKENFKK